MKTFEIRNGDLVIGPGGFGTITGPTKLRQDLAVAVREPYASDRFHPRWGSMLDTFVGQVSNPYSQSAVASEVHRLLGNYIAVQQDQITSDATRGVKPRYGTGEVISSVDSVQTIQTMDRLSVKVSLRTLSGEQVTLISSTGV